LQEITDLQATALNPPMPHSAIGTRTVVHNLLPITQFTSYHPDPNINFQLNRFLIPGLEITEVLGQQIASNEPREIDDAKPAQRASPGMEGGVPQKYDVVLFGPAGRQPFMRFVGSEVAG
jgi:hypothetical protein